MPPGGEWVRYWHADGVPVEAMHAHFTSHVYHRHSHESYSFGVTETGAQAFRCRHGRHVSAAGMVMAFNPDDPHDGRAADDVGFTYRMVHIWPEYLAGLCGTRLPLFASPVIDDPAAAGALRALHAALTGPAAKLERDERLAATAALLVRHATAHGPSHDSPASAGAAAAARIRELIHDGAAGLSAGDLAAAAGCSRYAAYRAFVRAFGLTPGEYQRQLRVRMARRLLAEGVPPALAAAQAGFADQAHLTRWFRKYYGITPGGYRSAVRRCA